MSEINKTPATIREILFRDCDPYGHLMHSNYLEYMLNARDAHLKDNYQIDIYTMARETGRSWVITTNQLAYIMPARVTQRVVIESQLIGATEAELQSEVRMFSEKKDRLLALLWIRQLHFDLNTSTVVPHHPKLMETFMHIVVPLKEKTFSERQATFRK